MAKLKAPFLSLEAHKTIGGAVTVQRRAGVNFIREKPVPSYRYSLPQAYQRWLYEDYAYLWRQQSAAARATYRSAGVRFHLTGFQYWMKDMLTRLPDIAAWYKLDAGDTVVAQDSGRQGNDGVVFGASPADGVIQDCLSFDNLNDWVAVPGSTSLDITSPLSIELFLTFASLPPAGIFVEYGRPLQNTQWGFGWVGGLELLLYYWDGGAWRWNNVAWTPLQDTWYHLVAQFTGTWVEYYINGAFFNRVAQVNEPWHAPGASLHLAADRTPATEHHGLLDNIIIRNRALDSTEILRHSLRRYPA